MGSPVSSSSSYLWNFNDDEEDEVISACVKVVNELVASSSVPRPVLRRTRVHRDREAANNRLMNDYFSETPTYRNPKTFARRFRMSKRLFLRVAHDLEENFDYFKQRRDGMGRLGFTAIQKCTSALRVLAYGYSTDFNDDYLKMADKTTRDCLEHFTEGIDKLYGARYLRKPTWNDIQTLYQHHDQVHGLPGMIGSIDCKHWQWENCPTAWKGQFTRGDQKGPTVILQAVASCDQWIWHAHFGVAGSNNDINVLEGSQVIEDYVSGKQTNVAFYANGNYYPHGYLLGDGIYPEYSFIVKTFKDPLDEKRKYFKTVQEAARKDIECTFGTLVKKWHYVKYPCRLWTMTKMTNCMRAIIIMHNMIKEDEGLAICSYFDPSHVEDRPYATMEERVQNTREMRSRERHNALMVDLIEHVWDTRPPPNAPQPQPQPENNDDEDDDDDDDDDEDDDDDDDEGDDGDDEDDESDEDEAYDDVPDDD